MLTRIEVDGFKTFEDFRLDLNPFLVIVGPNATGKSNLFDAIQLLSHLASDDLRTAFSGLRGDPDELFRIGADGRPRDSMRLAVEVLLNPSVQDPWGRVEDIKFTRIRYEVGIERKTDDRGIERLVVTHESATPIMATQDRWKPHGKRPSKGFKQAYMHYGRTSPFLSTSAENGNPTFNIHQDPRAGRTRSAIAAEATILSSITSAEFPHLFALREEMRTWKFLQLDPGALRKPSPKNAPETLEADGSNLPTVLARIKAETRSGIRPQGDLADIAADLAGLISGPVGIEVEEDELNRRYRIQIQTGEKEAFSSQVISDGTLRVLALLTLLHDPKHAGLVCFEEPENGIHPARLAALINVLRSMVTRAGVGPGEEKQPLSQMLLNSHSPVVLSHLDSSELVFADTVTTLDPAAGTRSRRTRMRPVRPREQGDLLAVEVESDAYADKFEVDRYLRTVTLQSA
ncbi:MAG TPA: AAA family ATPase [Longimicrobiaceae bacterium]|nr:AAA family ATPase [Longimicrobiaceae bacterium]